MKTVTIEIPDDCEVKIVKKEEKPMVRTYQDLIDNDKLTHEGYYISNDSKIMELNNYTIAGLTDRNVAASEKVCKSMLAMAMISQLMPYYGGAITDKEWENINNKYVIVKIRGVIHTDDFVNKYHFLAFHTKEQRDNFLKYNERLVKDYLMIG